MAMSHRARARSRTSRGTVVGDAAGARGSGDGRDVDVRIGALTLDDARRADAYPIGESVRRELERLLVERGVPEPLTGPGSHDRIDAAMGRWPSHARVERIGATIARAVYHGLTQANRLSAPAPVRSGRSESRR